jgi:hypothetical protein
MLCIGGNTQHCSRSQDRGSVVDVVLRESLPGSYMQLQLPMLCGMHEEGGLSLFLLKELPLGSKTSLLLLW